MQVIVGGLRSATTYNGQFGVLVGADTEPPYRHHVRLLSSGNVLRARAENLCVYPNGELLLDEQTARKLVDEALQSFTDGFLESSERQDVVGRAMLCGEFVNDGNASPMLIDCCDLDAAIEHCGGAHSSLTRFMKSAISPCRGDGRVNVLRFAQGLRSASQVPVHHELLIKRLREFIVSGLCEKCQAVFFERPSWVQGEHDPNEDILAVP
ncbi:hypothetical protein P43SY_008478 [Pythium insidiosum]|uniref:Uncharacterized protein n=1 Tax=Pythium insidiosum TaxID=114742 RepID=A0AAD5LU60_PYTIN|nr:hypothetical protein P43SY_008478 [Pythium insidiosum]KAJ0412408.1 hypothetical protein ATCC90586_005428 [Pythium insidiosum]